jgi:hypothetical protein
MKVCFYMFAKSFFQCLNKDISFRFTEYGTHFPYIQHEKGKEVETWESLITTKDDVIVVKGRCGDRVPL